MRRWSDLLSQDDFNFGISLANKAQQKRENQRIIYLPQKKIFRALELTPPDRVKVYLVGQDPYHTPGQVNRLAFSISPEHPLQLLLKRLISCAAIYPDNQTVIENLIQKTYLLSSHPSPFSATKMCRKFLAFKSSKPFFKTNILLQKFGSEPIDWSLE